MKKLIAAALMLLMVSACGTTPTGPAEDLWDREEKEDKINIGKIFGGDKKKKATEKENQELRARVERLERQQGVPSSAPSVPASSSSDITAPPALGTNTGRVYQPSGPQDSVSYQEWLRAKQNNSSDYKEFKEYQEWLEYQKLKDKR